MRINLHQAVVHLPEQMRECGSLAVQSELVMERATHWFKEGVRARITPCKPEYVPVQKILAELVLAEHLAKRPQLRALLAPPAPRPADGPDYDPHGDPRTRTRLLRKGTLESGGEALVLLQYVRKFVASLARRHGVEVRRPCLRVSGRVQLYVCASTAGALVCPVQFLCPSTEGPIRGAVNPGAHPL